MFKRIIFGVKGFWKLAKKLFWSSGKIAFLIYLGLFVNLVCWGIFFWIFRVEQSLVILHYNVFLGIDSVTNIELGKDYLKMYLAPIGGIFFWAFNLFLVFILGIFSDFQEKAKNENGLKGKDSNNRKCCEALDPGILAIYVVLCGGVVLQMTILLHAISIFFVNR
jgi:hypothetical protein